MNRSPALIRIMLACHTSGSPREECPRTWDSAYGREAIQWLLDEGLIDVTSRSTPKGRAWVDFIISTPLPVATWSLPERSHTEFTEGREG